jgi:predicted AlkP superfamily phosphohydrolase/phosphomutase
MMNSPRLVLIGLDAVDSRLVRQWAGEGHLPTLARVLASAAVAPIITPRAVLEGGVWPTFLTSSSPASHGMFAYQQLKRGTYDLEVAMHADRLPLPPFWERTVWSWSRGIFSLASIRSPTVSGITSGTSQPARI